MKANKSKLSAMLCAILLVTSFSLSAQDSLYNYKSKEKKDEVKTIFGGKGSNGFMIGLDMSMGFDDNMESLEIGGRIGGIVSHTFVIGAQASAMIGSNVTRKTSSGEQTIELNGGYGGLFLQPIILPKLPVHISIPVLLGVGGAGYYDINDFDTMDGDAFIIVKPGVEIGFNLVKFMRLNVGAYYKYLYGFSGMNGIDKNSLNGFSGGVSLIFGKF